MSIDHILKRIEQGAAASADAIMEEAEREAQEIEKTFSAEAEVLRERLEHEARRKSEEAKRRILVNEKLELGKSVLEKKREILDGVYEKAKERISSLADDEYLDMIKGMILSRAITGSEEIVFPKDQEALFDSDFFEALNSSFPGTGSFERAPEAGSFEWGVILRQGKRVVDLRLDVLMEQLREGIEHRIAAVLFPVAQPGR